MSLAKPDGAVEKLPDSVWLQHKNVLRHLYITENKPLSVVKQTMENEHGFKPQRLCDYEVALRDILHFRKNLKRAEWRAIGIHISERKRQAKESEVIWNKTPFEAKKLRKELQRNSQPKSGGSRKVNIELPQGLVIRTPPRSPATSAAVLLPLIEPQLVNNRAVSPQSVRGGSNHAVNSASKAYETIWEAQRALLEAREFGVSPYRKLRENLPFNRCMSQVVDLGQLNRSHLFIPTAETSTTVSPRLFGTNPSWELFARQIYKLSNLNNFYDGIPENIWFLKWVGASADFALLTSFFSIKSPTAGAVYESLLTNAARFHITDLLGVLFALRSVLRLNHPMSVDDSGFVYAAIRMGSQSGDCLNILNTCLNNMPSISTFTNWTSSLVLIAAERGDIAVLRTLVNAGCRAEPQSQERDELLIGEIMSRIYDWNLHKEDEIMVYIELLVRGGVLDTTTSSQCSDDRRPRVIVETYAIGSLTWDELVMICPPMMRNTLQKGFMGLRADQGTGITRAGVFTAAEEGGHVFRAYLKAHRDDDTFRTRVVLEESLLFAAVVNDWKTAFCLLEIGVDPQVGLLSDNLKRYQKGSLTWNPSIVAAAAGHLEVLKLTLLFNKTDVSYFLGNAPVHELVRHENLREDAEINLMGRELCRLGNLHRSYLLAQTRNYNVATECSLDERKLWNARLSIGRNFETLAWIRSVAHSQGYGQKVDLDIIKAAVCHQRKSWRPDIWWHLPCDALLMKGLVDAHLDYKEKGIDLLHLSIRNHCSFKVVRYLLDKGSKIHSKLNGQGCNTMLHDALLSRSPDRSDIVEFLLQQGADCKVRGDGLSILEASLWNFSFDMDDESAEYTRIFERLLDAGATASQWPRKRVKKWRPLIELLVDIQASDDLILRVIDAGAPLNACGYGYERITGSLTPLQAAVWHKRERLARELIRRGADVHVPASQYGLTALQAACQQDISIGFVEYLVGELGVEINEHPAPVNRYTSLAAAVENGSLNTLEFLLDHGADVNAPCSLPNVFFYDKNHSCRPLDIAVFEGGLDQVEFLLKAGGRSARAGLGGAMYIAARRRHYAILSILRSWNDKHGRRIIEAETLWQMQNPEQALILSEQEDTDSSGSPDSEDYGDNKDDSGIGRD